MNIITNTKKYILVAGVVLIALIVLSNVVVNSNKHPKPSLNLNLGVVGNSSPSSAPASSFKGIIIETGDAGGNVILSAYDPAQGLVATRNFSLNGFSTANFNAEIPSTDTRQLFNKDYTKMAVYQSNADGSSNIGYIDSSGNFTNLTPQASSYSGGQKQSSPVFNPASGRIWFNTPTKLGSVDPEKGATSSQLEPFDSFIANTVALGSNDEIVSFYFTPDGKTPLIGNGSMIGPPRPYSPTGRSDYPTISADCSQVTFIDNNRLLCFGGDTQLYLFTISADWKSMKTKVGLLPASDKLVLSAVADPSGNQVAFITRSGSVLSLYTTSTAGGSEPKKVTDFNTSSAALLSWE